MERIELPPEERVAPFVLPSPERPLPPPLPLLRHPRESGRARCGSGLDRIGWVHERQFNLSLSPS